MSTCRFIAAACGYSKASVSLALRGDPRIPAATRAKICAVAGKLGYQPDPKAASYLAHVRRKRPEAERPVIAVVHTFAETQPWLGNRFLEFFRKTTAERAAVLGYRVEWFQGGPKGHAPTALGRILRARGIEGVLLAPSGLPANPLPKRLERFALAACTERGWRPVLHRAQPDHYQNSRVALARLAQLGYRRIGLAVVGEATVLERQEVEAAWRVWLAGTPDAQVVAPLRCLDYELDGLSSWLEAARPEVVLTNYSGLDEVLRERGWKVPGQVALAVIGIGEFNRGLAGVDARGAAVDAECVNLVAQQLVTGERGVPRDPRLVLFEGQWRDGPSAPPLRSARATVKPRRARG